MRALDYFPSYEMDGSGGLGALLALNVIGHGHALEDIEALLNYEEVDYEGGGGWEIAERWVRKVPRYDTMEHVYQDHPGPGAQAVTYVERNDGANRWCLNHPYEPWSTGIPATQVLDGEEIVQQERARAATETEPRMTVSDDRRWPPEGYIYLCRACSTEFSERQRRARKEALR